MSKPSNFDSTTIPLGQTCDDNGRLVSYRDKNNGHANVYTYNDDGRVVSQLDIDGSGFWCERTYDDDGNVLMCINSDGCREDYAYDDDGNCTITRTQEAA